MSRQITNYRATVANNNKRIKTLEKRVKKFPEPEKQQKDTYHESICGLTIQSALHPLRPTHQEVDGNQARLTGLYAEIWAKHDTTGLHIDSEGPLNYVRYVIYWARYVNGGNRPPVDVNDPFGLINPNEHTVLYDQVFSGGVTLRPVTKVKLNLKNALTAFNDGGECTKGDLYLQIVSGPDDSTAPMRTQWAGRTYFKDN